MSTPRSGSYDLAPKKSRATSCTNCRQVKLKCDFKEKYPNPCSRCATNRHECKTDASFKRVPARSRIKDLESQINQLKRDRALSQATSRSSAEFMPEVERRGSENSYGHDNLTVYPTSEAPSHGSPTNSDLSRTDGRWLNLMSLDEPSHFTLGTMTVPYSHALDLFQHFEYHYYPHFCILEPVTSLKQLHADSQFLFWSIVSIAARSHRQHAPLVDSLWPFLDGLQATTITDAVPCLLNLQALLLLCAFPFHTSCPLYQDSTWTQLSLAISAARQMGLDKSKDDVLFGTGNTHESINRFPRHIRHMTWMKCFQLDVQMSCWHGHAPLLASPQALRTTLSACEVLPTSNFAALVSVDIELAQALSSLDDSSQSPRYVVRTFVDRLNAVKTKWSHAWSLDAELELLAAKLYLYAALLAYPETSTQGDDEFYSDASQASYASATQLATLVANLSADSLANAASFGFIPERCPLPGRPRHHTQIAFFAAIVLFKYLDNDTTTSDEDKETAKNAFGRIYQMFSSCTSTSDGSESHNPARTLQVIGRVIGHGSGNLRPHVTTRMGASLVYNAVWLASQIQPGEPGSPGENILAAPSLLMGSPVGIATDTHPYSRPMESYDASYAATTAPFEDVLLSNAVWETATTVGIPSIEFGYPVWDNSVFDHNWQSSTLPYPPVTTHLGCN